MITQEEILNHVKTLVESFLTNNPTLCNFTRKYHNELYYKQEDTDIDITIITLPGDIQNEVVQYPLQIYVDAKTEFSNEIIEVLKGLSVSNNETLVTIGTTKVRQYYKTPSVINKFLKSGLYECESLVLECSLFEFDNLYDVEKFLIDGEEVKFVNFGLSYVGNTNSSGGLQNGIITQSIKSGCNSYTFTAVPKQTKLYRKFMALAATCEKQNRKFLVKLDMPIYDIVSITSPEGYATQKALGIYAYTTSGEFIKLTTQAYSSTTTYYKKIEVENYYVCPQITYTKDIKGFPVMQVTLMRCNNG